LAQSVLPDTADKNRLILGVGSGSTRDEFELLGYDYDCPSSELLGQRAVEIKRGSGSSVW
jgi:hypothetical protein